MRSRRGDRAERLRARARSPETVVGGGGCGCGGDGDGRFGGRTARGDEGSVTAEFAMILPALAVVLVLGVVGVRAGALEVQLADAAADAARMLGRGEDAGAAQQRVRSVDPSAETAVERGGGLVCVTASASAGAGALAVLRLDSRGCALDDTAGPLEGVFP